MADSAANPKMHVVVVVLGDVGRSPRMQYHALSLLQAGHTVSLVGYNGEDLIPELEAKRLQAQETNNASSSNSFHVIRFSVPSPPWLHKYVILYLLWRIVSLTMYLVHVLWVRVPKTKPVNVVLVQNPPAMPLLFVSIVFCVVHGIFTGIRPGLVIDWHNLGYSMLSHPVLSTIARYYEFACAPWANGHLCVTAAMKDFLKRTIPNISRCNNVNVLYDCPPAMFQPLSISEQHEFLLNKNIHAKLCKVCPPHWYQNLIESKQTLFTEQISDTVIQSRSNRPALITSSTSWTPDEDFSILLEALAYLDDTIQLRQSSLRIIVAVTGKGPQRTMYQQHISKLKFNSIAIQTLWLEPGDYPKLLACADVGVSLHTSTSGLDLPMKVLDLFGCQVPVCARNFRCLSELVHDDENGRIFESSEELASQLWNLLQSLGTEQNNKTPPTPTNIVPMEPHSFGKLQRYSKELNAITRWSANWTTNALPVIEKAAGRGR